MTFVQMKHVGSDVQVPQQSHAPNTKKHFLDNPRLSVASVKMTSDPAIGFSVLWNVRVQQIKLYSPHISLPDLGEHFAIANQYFDLDRRIVSIFDERNW